MQLVFTDITVFFTAGVHMILSSSYLQCTVSFCMAKKMPENPEKPILAVLISGLCFRGLCLFHTDKLPDF